jgi:tuberculosinol/isotuberculosinol synthase
MQHMTREKFMQLSKDELGRIVRGDRAKTCVFPFDGTRRWFLLEYGREFDGDATKNYAELTAQAYIAIYKLVFDHGLDNIVAPVFGGETLKRGEEYMREIGAAMSLLATHPAFIEFYKDYDVRVHFYGDYRKLLNQTPYAYICDLFDEITRQTAQNKGRALFYGVCADDATVTIAELAIKYYQDNNRTPSRRDLIEQYYGEYIEKADIFIGFEKFTVFDYPMLGWGMESLYYSVAPSLYMNERQLRNILYDHVYLRPVPDPDFFTIHEADFESMRKFYEANREAAYGIGEIRGGIWYAKPNGKEEG